MYWKGDRLIHVPKASLDPAEAVILILNYIIAYQSLHRVAKVKKSDKVLVIGASGGIGTALLQLGKLTGLIMYAIASKSKHAILSDYGATPIDYRTQDFVEVIRQAKLAGLEAVLSGMTGLDYIKGGVIASSAWWQAGKLWRTHRASRVLPHPVDFDWSQPAAEWPQVL